MTVDEFRQSIGGDGPGDVSASLAALWWEAKGDWPRAHGLVDDLETREGMMVHAYLHRREGDLANAGYWYHRAGIDDRQDSMDKEWEDLVRGLLA
jgi:hypothetical protein